jgi:hypothetical protein
MAACSSGEVWRRCLCVGRKRADTVRPCAPYGREILARDRGVHFDAPSRVSFPMLIRRGISGLHRQVARHRLAKLPWSQFLRHFQHNPPWGARTDNGCTKPTACPL